MLTSFLNSPQPGQSVGMLAAVEHGPILCSDSNILCLSWKGRVPKSEKDKPVCRRRYYEEGWLATGNGRGVVGVTFTSSHCRRDRSTPQRINFNLRGHNSEVWASTYTYSTIAPLNDRYNVCRCRLCLCAGMNPFRNWPPVTWRGAFLYGSSMKEDGLWSW